MLANFVIALADAANLPVDGQGEAPNPALPVLLPLEDQGAAPGEMGNTVLAEVSAHFGTSAPPNVFRALAHQPRLLQALWSFWKSVFLDRELPHRTKVMLAYSCAATRNSVYGMTLFGRQLERLQVSPEHRLALLLTIGWYNGITKLADLLQIESEVSDEDIQRTRAAGG